MNHTTQRCSDSAGWTDQACQALPKLRSTRVRTAGTDPGQPLPRALGCSRAFGWSGVPLAVGLLCTQTCTAGDVGCGGRIRLAVCAREQHGSDVCTRVIGCVVRCAPFRRLRWQSTGNSGQPPHLAVSLCSGDCEWGAVECGRVLCGLAVLCAPCRAVVPCAITARLVCSGAVDLAQLVCCVWSDRVVRSGTQMARTDRLLAAGPTVIRPPTIPSIQSA